MTATQTTRASMPEHAPAITITFFFDILLVILGCEIEEGEGEAEGGDAVRLVLSTACDDSLDEPASECVTLFAL